jgi:hypothetical protein
MARRVKIKTRDYLMVRLIQGATKSAVHTDRRKAANKRACRVRVQREVEQC